MTNAVYVNILNKIENVFSILIHLVHAVDPFELQAEVDNLDLN